MNHARFYLLLLLLCAIVPAQAVEAIDLFKSPPAAAKPGRQEIVNQIRDSQNRIKTLQDTLRTMEKNDAIAASAKGAGGQGEN